jgi:hypothetical protein
MRSLRHQWEHGSTRGSLCRSPFSYFFSNLLDGIIDRAAEWALRGIRPREDQPIDKSIPQERDRLGARTFVPSLVQVSETGESIRRVARLEDFDADARELLNAFVQWRLLVTKQIEPLSSSQSDNSENYSTTVANGGGSTVEVAHEVIFRGWERFRRWLELLKADLETHRALENAARDWDRYGRKRGFVHHRGPRLKAAKRLESHPDFKNRITATERAYISAASRAQGWKLFGASAVAAVLTLFGAIAFAQYGQFGAIVETAISRAEMSSPHAEQKILLAAFALENASSHWTKGRARLALQQALNRHPLERAYPIGDPMADTIGLVSVAWTKEGGITGHNQKEAFLITPDGKTSVDS